MLIDLEKERAKRGLPPSRQLVMKTYLNELTKPNLTPEQELRIKASLQKINDLMQQLKTKAREDNNGRE